MPDNYRTREMIAGGYILQPRCFDLSVAVHFPPCTRELWFYLLRTVNHTDNGKFKRGSGLYGLDEIQEALSWSVGYRVERYSKPQLTKALRRLREESMIETAKATRGVFVTVLNYDKYQDPSNYEGNGEGNAKATRRQREGIYVKQEERIKNEEVKDYCAEPQKNEVQAPAQDGRLIIVFPLSKKGEEFCFYQKDLDQWKESFPGINVECELLKCRQWNLDNPTKRKTRAGIRKHISGWLGKAQDGQHHPAGLNGHKLSVRDETALLNSKTAEFLNGKGNGCSSEIIEIDSCGNNLLLESPVSRMRS